MRCFLDKIDARIYKFLKRYVNIMPLRFVKLVAYYYTDARIRKLYFRRLGVKMGKNTYANPGMKITVHGNGDFPEIIIGRNVSIGPNAVFIADSCANNGEAINQILYVRDVLTKNENIIIDDDVWIGANVTILPGVRIGKCSVIGAGSVVTANVEEYSVYAGVPAKKIRELNKVK